MANHLFRNIIVLLLLVLAGCILSLIYWHNSLDDPKYMTIEGNTAHENY